MELKSFDELLEPDPRTLAFAPMGLIMAGRLGPEHATEFQQLSIANCDLADNVAEGTRSSFERLRTLHSYGVLCYETFTVARDLAWLLLEQALRERFVEFYRDGVPLENGTSGIRSLLMATDFSAVDRAFRRGGSYSQGTWRLVLSNGRSMKFSGSMGHLQEWARAEGFLVGQRNRRLDALFREFRNAVAHPSYHLVTPVESGRTIRDLAETINRLWGHPTPGGRLYPAPLERDVMVVAWTGTETGLTHIVMRADQLKGVKEPETWTCVVLRGVHDDEGLWEYDARYERTSFPT